MFQPKYLMFQIMEHALVLEYFGACHYIRVHSTHLQKVVVSYIVACSRMRGNTVQWIKNSYLYQNNFIRRSKLRFGVKKFRYFSTIPLPPIYKIWSKKYSPASQNIIPRETLTSAVSWYNGLRHIIIINAGEGWVLFSKCNINIVSNVKYTINTTRLE